MCTICFSLYFGIFLHLNIISLHPKMFSHAAVITYKFIDVVGSYFQLQWVTNDFFQIRQGGLKMKICIKIVIITGESWVSNIDRKVTSFRTTQETRWHVAPRKCVVLEKPWPGTTDFNLSPMPEISWVFFTHDLYCSWLIFFIRYSKSTHDYRFPYYPKRVCNLSNQVERDIRQSIQWEIPSNNSHHKPRFHTGAVSLVFCSWLMCSFLKQFFLWWTNAIENRSGKKRSAKFSCLMKFWRISV